jgi:hypothetical protein
MDREVLCYISTAPEYIHNETYWLIKKFHPVLTNNTWRQI